MNPRTGANSQLAERDYSSETPVADTAARLVLPAHVGCRWTFADYLIIYVGPFWSDRQSEGQC
jgi:hypothetical protein